MFFSLFHKLEQFIHLKWLLNILYHVSHSYLVISSQIKHWFFLYFVNGDRHIFRKNAHVVGKIEINTTCNRFSNLKVLDITITTETLLINNIAELVIITEVKFIKKFLHAVGENCHGNKKVYIVNHKGNVHGKQSLMIFISSFSSCVPLLSQFRKPVGTVSCFVKVQRGLRDNTILHRQKRLLSFKTTILCIS